MNTLRRNFGYIYYVIPFLVDSPNVKNKIDIIFSLLRNNESINLKLNNIKVKFSLSQFKTFLNVIGLIKFSTSYSIDKNYDFKISLDEENYFDFNLKNLNFEDENLLELLFEGVKHGANFINGEKQRDLPIRDKTLRILTLNDKKIVETANGLKFFIDSILPGVTIVEPFVQNAHQINENDDWNNKVVLDIGAQCGDTPLYYASRGATVYAFEPIKGHYEAMIKNIEINPELKNKINPVNAAMGKDEILTFYQSNKSEIAGMPSFVYNSFGKDAKITKIQGYSLSSIYEKFQLKHVDLLKMDCKGCEFFVNKDELDIVNVVKIEYLADGNEHTLNELTQVLKSKGFEIIIYRIDPFHRVSNNENATIYAKRPD